MEDLKRDPTDDLERLLKFFETDIKLGLPFYQLMHGAKPKKKFINQLKQLVTAIKAELFVRGGSQ